VGYKLLWKVGRAVVNVIFHTTVLVNVVAILIGHWRHHAKVRR